jgi:hypothetical protein
LDRNAIEKHPKNINAGVHIFDFQTVFLFEEKNGKSSNPPYFGVCACKNLYYLFCHPTSFLMILCIMFQDKISNYCHSEMHPDDTCQGF